MNMARLYKQLKPELKTVEKRLEQAVEADHPILRQASYQLLKAGGKRIRPVFVLLSARFGREERSSLVPNAAVILELIHMASLVHDDVVDDSELRRGKKTVKAQWDNRVAMYTGDFIFARALNMMCDFDRNDTHGVLSKAIKDMCLGEIVQIKDQHDWSQNFRRYLYRIKRKTALLMAVSCELGAMVADADYRTQRHLYYFGYFAGMSFQITDDILDFIASEEQLGKPAGSDIRQGNLTLPALYAYHHKSTSAEMNQMLHQSEKELDWDHIINLVRESGGIEESQRISAMYLDKAYHALEQLPEIDAKKSLYAIADYIGKRNH